MSLSDLSHLLLGIQPKACLAFSPEACLAFSPEARSLRKAPLTRLILPSMGKLPYDRGNLCCFA